MIEPCQYERPLNQHLSTCKSPEKCIYQRHYPNIRTPYCQKKLRMEDCRDKGIETKLDGEEYHERNKYVNNRKPSKPIDPDISLGEGV